MTLEKAIKILNENVILSPKASKFKEAIEVVKFALEHQQAVINNLKKDCSVVEVNLEEAFLKECECEIEKAKEAGGEIVSLGKRILRTETASIAALAICMFNIEANLI